MDDFRHARAVFYVIMVLHLIQPAREAIAMSSPSAVPVPVLEAGRLRVCGHLLVSVNRSWRVEAEAGKRPSGAFKGLAPLAPMPPPSGANAGTSWLAAIGANDAFWLGFESDASHSYAVLVDIDGRNGVTGDQAPVDALRLTPLNFLIAPDQPWFDTMPAAGGNFRQLLPRLSTAPLAHEAPSATVVRVTVFKLEETALQPKARPEGPIPHYGAHNSEPTSEEPAPHAWPARAFIGSELPQEPCVKLAFTLVRPDQFEAITGQSLPAALFDDSAGPPPPYNPLGLTP